jgi:hypothetical protein
VVNQRSFYVALAPIVETEGESIWASGRVPTDVTKITYGLPGGQVVDAKLNKEGYWMFMFHSSGSTVAPGKVEDWPPMTVTVSRPSGDRQFTIRLSKKTMCNQMTHRC